MIPLPETKDEVATPYEIQSFMDKHGFSKEEFGELLGVTRPAVHLWVTGQRSFGTTNTKLLRLLERRPHLIREI